MAEKKDYSSLKAALEAQRNRIVEGLDHIERDNLKRSQRDAAGDLSGYSFHLADVATDNFDRELNLDLASSEQSLLNRVDGALQKLKDGTYGVCENCGKSIGLKRLKAVPYAELCIKCKEAEEQKPRRQ